MMNCFVVSSLILQEKLEIFDPDEESRLGHIGLTEQENSKYLYWKSCANWRRSSSFKGETVAKSYQREEAVEHHDPTGAKEPL